MWVCLGADLGNGLGESTAGLVADPHLVFGAEGQAHGLQLRVHALVRETLHAQLRLGGRVQLQVLPHRRVLDTLPVYEKPDSRIVVSAWKQCSLSPAWLLGLLGYRMLLIPMMA